MPDHETIKQSRWIRPFGTWRHHPTCAFASPLGGGWCRHWHILRPDFRTVPDNRRCIAGGAVRVNLPVAMFATFYTNPLTIVSPYVLAYELGAFVKGQHNGLSTVHFVLPEMNWSNWHTVLLDWAISLGKPYEVALLLLAISLAISGYFVVSVL